MRKVDGQFEKPKGSLAIRLKEYNQAKKKRKAKARKQQITKLRCKAKACKEQIEKLLSMPYGTYLQSAHWQKLRRYMSRRFTVCQNCGGDEDLQVHHKTYVRRGEEDPERDLIMLCGTCHGAHHKNDDEMLIAALDLLSLRDGSGQAAKVAKELCTKVGPRLSRRAMKRRGRGTGKRKRRSELGK